VSDLHKLSVRLPVVLMAELDKLAAGLDRPRNWVVNRALEDYVAMQAWQLAQIKRGLSAAKAGQFASEAEVEAAFAAFGRPRHRAD
jgi:predicted transcriptional regulator